MDKQKLVKHLVSRGKSENQALAIAENVATLSRRSKAQREDHLAKQDQSWKDCQLMAPTSEWDRTDLKGDKVGNQLLWVPTEAYKRNFDSIDWGDA